MITIATIHNPFNEDVNIVERKEFIPGGVLTDYLPGLIVKEGEKLVVAVNGDIVDIPLNQYQVRDHDRIAVSLKIEVSGAALAVAGYFAASGTLTFMAIYGLTYLATSMAIMYGASYLINALGLIPQPPGGGTDIEQSPTYGWGPIQALENPGRPIPLLIGSHRVAGQIISRFLTTDTGFWSESVVSHVEVNDVTWPNGVKKYTRRVPHWLHNSQEFTERYNVMLAVNDGPINSITDIRINEQPYTNYDGVSVRTSLGGTNPTAFPLFGDIVTPNPVNYNLNEPGSSFTFETQGNLVEEIRVILSAPNGLYGVSNRGNLRDRSVHFTVEFRPVGTGASWELFYNVHVTAAENSEIRRKVRIGGLNPGKYEVRVTRITRATQDINENMDWTWISMDEVVNEGLSYPGISCYAVSAIATDQLSGQSPTITALASKNWVDVYNPEEGWQWRTAQNPAWATYYLLNTVHGIVPSRIIYDEFVEWANYCDEVVEGEPRFRVSKVFDSLDTAWNMIQEMARYGRGKVIRRGTKYGVFVDKPETVVSHMFTMGNILTESFSMEYLPIKDRANAVEVTYTDPDRDYTRQIISIYTTDYRTGTGVPRKADIRFNAAITRDRAMREAAFLLNCNKYILRTIEFEAFVDSFACVVGDVIYFQHSIPHYDDTMGGRVVEAGNDDGSGNAYVKFDRTVTLEIGKAYSVLVRYDDDTITEKIVLGPTDVETDQVVIQGSWTVIPEEYNVYAFGETETYKKRYRIIGITREQELTRRITCIEYSPHVYTDDGYYVDEPTPPVIIRPQEAVNVNAKEFLTYGSGGDFVPNIQVNWHSANEVIFNDWGIWLENITTARYFDDSFADTDDGIFQATSDHMRKYLVGTTKENNFVINSGDIRIGQEYRITVNPIDRPKAITGSNQTVIQVWGKYAPPSDVLNFTGVWDVLKRIVVFTWDDIGDIDLSHYEIRQGEDWDTGIRVVREAKDRSAVHFIEEGTVQERTYMIKAVDTTGNYSVNPAVTEVTIDTYSSDVQAPENLQATTESIIVEDGTSRTLVILTWDALSELSDRFSHYEILMEYTSSGSRQVLTTFTNHYTLEVLPNIELMFAVRAIDLNGNRTVYSNSITIMSAKDEVPPAIPLWDSPALVPGFKIIGLRFEEAPDADFSHLVVERSYNGNFTWEHTVIGNFSGNFLIDNDLLVDQEYWYRAKAVDTSGNESDFSTVQSAITLQVGQADIAYNSIIAQHIDVLNLTALSAKVTGTLSAGVLQSNNWGANSGSRFNLNDGVLTIGGYSAPKMHFDGVNLSVPNLSALSSNIGTIYSGILRSSDWGGTGGMEIHLDNRRIRMGGWGNPIFDLDENGLFFTSPNFWIDKQGHAFFGGTLAANTVKTENIEIDGLTGYASVHAEESHIVHTTSTSWVDMPGMNLWLQVREHAKLLIIFHANVWNTTSGRSVDTRITRAGIQYPAGLASRHTSAYADSTGNNTGFAIIEIPAGYRNFKVQWRVTAGTGGVASRRLYVYQFLR